MDHGSPSSFYSLTHRFLLSAFSWHHLDMFYRNYLYIPVDCKKKKYKKEVLSGRLWIEKYFFVQGLITVLLSILSKYLSIYTQMVTTYLCVIYMCVRAYV